MRTWVVVQRWGGLVVLHDDEPVGLNALLRAWGGTCRRAASVIAARRRRVAWVAWVVGTRWIQARFLGFVGVRRLGGRSSGLRTDLELQFEGGGAAGIVSQHRLKPLSPLLAHPVELEGVGATDTDGSACSLAAKKDERSDPGAKELRRNFAFQLFNALLPLLKHTRLRSGTRCQTRGTQPVGSESSWYASLVV